MTEPTLFNEKHRPKNIDEMITSARQIDKKEYLRLFDEDNEYLKNWSNEQKLNWINKVDYNA